MSATFTLPISAIDHGHNHTHSNSRSHQRNRASSRLSQPYPLPRIPSESIMQPNDDLPPPGEVAADDFSESRTHRQNRSSIHSHPIIPAPILNTSGEQMIGKRKGSNASSYNAPRASHRHTFRNVSKPTELLLHTTENYSLLHGILADPDSRRIFYFMLLNLAFMGVQSTYGFLTGSLGLISDSIHMFFDCLALLLGLCAAVMSRWPPNDKFPYGYGKIDTLAGLGNGIFLMLISIEIIYEAIERLFSGSDLSRTTELLVVSTIGLCVNIVGIFAFHGHGHDHSHGSEHNHSHSHSHSHGHGHGHGHDDCSTHNHHNHSHKHNHHDHDHDHEKSHSHSQSNAASSSPTKSKNLAISGHHHGGESMEGIYLHIMADALGSVAVVCSTILVQITGWSGFDPIASCIIAVLIFISTVPLVTSTTKKLLLSLNSDIEYNLRDILAGVSAIRGVSGYKVPKFWLEDIKKESGHHHGHEHHHHSHEDSNDSPGGEDPTIFGVIHIIASQTAELGDVKERVSAYLTARKMDITVQVEREGEARCWCGGSSKIG